MSDKKGTGADGELFQTHIGGAATVSYTHLDVYKRQSRPRDAVPSTAGHEEPGGKQGGPPPKAKHSPATDSGPVP